MTAGRSARDLAAARIQPGASALGAQGGLGGVRAAQAGQAAPTDGGPTEDQIVDLTYPGERAAKGARGQDQSMDPVVHAETSCRARSVRDAA